MMRTKLMAVILVTAIGLVAAPAALDQLRELKDYAGRWANNPVLGGVATAHAGGNKTESVAPASHATVAIALQSSGDEFRWSGRVAAGRTVEIKGVSGGIRAEPSAGGEVEVTAVKSSRRSDTREVEIRVVEHAGGVTICAVYPSPDSGRPNQCGPGNEGSMNVRNNDVSVEFMVRVPQGVRFSARTVNGDVETGALGADVEAKTVNGSIKTSAAGVVRAKTVNGSITASLGSAEWSGPLEFKTVNGTITLSLPAGTGAEVRAETVNGEIATDFPMTILGSVSRKRLNGTIGGGGRQLLLKTVNGSINLRRAS